MSRRRKDDDTVGVIDHPDQVRVPGTERVAIAGDRLRSIVQRWERLDGEVKELRSDQKDIMAEAKSAGFDVAVIRQLIRIRKREPADVDLQESLLDLYRDALEG